MAKIKIAGDAIVIESTRTLDDIKTLEKYRPNALVLRDENDEEYFRVGTTRGKGSIGSYGASFGSASKDEAKKAIITLELPSDTTDAVAYVEEAIGAAILNLNKVEEAFDSVLGEIAAEKDRVRESIVVM